MTAPVRPDTATGVDTGGGQAETGCCLRLGRIIMPIQAAREGHNTINAALAVVVVTVALLSNLLLRRLAGGWGGA